MDEKEKTALLIIDMVKDNFDESKKMPITFLAKETIGPINALIREIRKSGGPVVFSTDAFQKEDFIFTGRLRPHSLAGTEGAEVIDELDMGPDDLWLPKPRFSAFFGTDLAKWLRERDVTRCAVAGIATHICVLSTAMDAVCHDFKTAILEDCSASYSKEIHEKTLGLYRKNPLAPLLRVAASKDIMEEL
ncbi:Isochorismatase [Candidatus Desulfarcum epimagneticum]|uniref:Isochorismatase n=1 Tax=uncultured Desulfobacteraceae bacterium TaxID=218296 RepID=A0A484HKA4_9BACT|nr:Isochorismatase [uncultured Desulfobacteraceae bacterium]